jgi:uncharacterized protein
VIGLETPELLVHELEECNQTSHKHHNERFKDYYYEGMSGALQHHISAINHIIETANCDKSYAFSGFDSSAAPSKDCASMIQLYTLMEVEYFGAGRGVFTTD